MNRLALLRIGQQSLCHDHREPTRCQLLQVDPTLGRSSAPESAQCALPNGRSQGGTLHFPTARARPEGSHHDLVNSVCCGRHLLEGPAWKSTDPRVLDAHPWRAALDRQVSRVHCAPLVSGKSVTPRPSTESHPMKASSSHAWIGGFAVRLMQLKPGLHAGPAIHLAVQNHESGCGTQPQTAAEEYVRRQVDAIDRIIASLRPSA